jgi:hypothetical protein
MMVQGQLRNRIGPMLPDKSYEKSARDIMWNCSVFQDVFFITFLTQYRAGDKIEKNEMGWAYGAYG